MAVIKSDINKAIELLKADELVAIPTETVYGLAGNALSEKALVKIFDVKNRPRFDPLILHTSDFERISPFLKSIPEKAMDLASTFWPGPLTLLLPRNDGIPDLLTAGLDRVAVRIPDHAVTRELLSHLDFPLAAPSANPFGYVSPTTAQHVEDQLGQKIPYILDGGPCSVGIESTIIGFEDQEVMVHRVGGIEVEQIEEVVGPVKLDINISSNPLAPGMYKAHYAPGKRLVLGDIAKLTATFKDEKVGLITFADSSLKNNVIKHIALSHDRNLREAAASLFRALREMDQAPVDIIIAEEFPENGLGRAINDRLKRASIR